MFYIFIIKYLKMGIKKIRLTETQLVDFIEKLITEQSLNRGDYGGSTNFALSKQNIYDPTQTKKNIKQMIKAGYISSLRSGKVYVTGFSDPIMTKNLDFSTFIDQIKLKYSVSGDDILTATSEYDNEVKERRKRSEQERINHLSQEEEREKASKIQSEKPKWRKNDQFPIKPYDISSTIARIQTALGLPQNQQKGYFGSITINALKKIGIIIDPNKGIDATTNAQIFDKLGIKRGTDTPARDPQRQVGNVIPSIHPSAQQRIT